MTSLSIAGSNISKFFEGLNKRNQNHCKYKTVLGLRSLRTRSVVDKSNDPNEISQPSHPFLMKIKSTDNFLFDLCCLCLAKSVGEIIEGLIQSQYILWGYSDSELVVWGGEGGVDAIILFYNLS